MLASLFIERFEELLHHVTQHDEDNYADVRCTKYDISRIVCAVVGWSV